MNVRLKLLTAAYTEVDARLDGVGCTMTKMKHTANTHVAGKELIQPKAFTVGGLRAATTSVIVLQLKKVIF